MHNGQDENIFLQGRLTMYKGQDENIIPAMQHVLLDCVLRLLINYTYLAGTVESVTGMGDKE